MSTVPDRPNRWPEMIHSFLPAKYESYGPHTLIDVFHVGKFTAYCPISQTFSSYVCNDHGQYSWGHSASRGAMAVLCRKLGILYDSNTQNTCLRLHVLISIIGDDVMGIGDIVNKYGNFVKGLLSSRTMQDGDPTLTKIFRVMKLDDSICRGIIDEIDQDDFVLLDNYYGNIKKKTMYIVHVPCHFVIVKLIGF